MGKIISERDKLIALTVLALDKTYAAVSKEFDITPVRVGQIVRHMIRRFARARYDQLFDDSGAFDGSKMRQHSAEIVLKIRQG